MWWYKGARLLLHTTQKSHACRIFSKMSSIGSNVQKKISVLQIQILGGHMLKKCEGQLTPWLLLKRKPVPKRFREGEEQLHSHRTLLGISLKNRGFK
jgi:hypothetical protein